MGLTFPDSLVLDIFGYKWMSMGTLRNNSFYIGGEAKHFVNKALIIMYICR